MAKFQFSDDTLPPPQPVILSPSQSDEQSSYYSDGHSNNGKDLTRKSANSSSEEAGGSLGMSTTDLPRPSTWSSVESSPSSSTQQGHATMAEIASPSSSSTTSSIVSGCNATLATNAKRRGAKSSQALPVRKSQLTPRMALYIPPHLQKQTQMSAPTKPAPVAPTSPPVKLTPQQVKEKEQQLAKLRVSLKEYNTKQYNAMAKRNSASASTQENSQVETPESESSKKSKPCKPRLPEALWSKEMRNLLLIRNNSHEKFVKTGCKIAQRKSKQAKIKLRSLMRTARSNSQPKTFPNPYEDIKRKHELYENSEEYAKSFQHIDALKRKMASSRYTEDVSDPESLPEPREYDGSYYFSVSQRHLSRIDWSEAILDFNCSAGRKLKSPSEVVKVEVIDSDDDDNPSKSYSRSTNGKYSKDRQLARADKTSDPNRSTASRSSQASSEPSMDVSNNEYLNQQFLRRQHDYEREQKYHQIELESKTTSFSPSRADNFLVDFNYSRKGEMLEEPCRKFGMNEHGPIHCGPIMNSVHPPPEKEPIEPFVDNRRRRKHPAEINAERLEAARIEEMLKVMYGDDYFKVAQEQPPPPRYREPVGGRFLNYPYRGHLSPAAGSSSVRLYRSSRENSPVAVRNYHSHGVHNGRQLSPFSERMSAALEAASRPSPFSERIVDRQGIPVRQLSPFSERVRGRSSRARQLSPFSERNIRREGDKRTRMGGELDRCPTFQAPPRSGKDVIVIDDDDVRAHERRSRESSRRRNSSSVDVHARHSGRDGDSRSCPAARRDGRHSTSRTRQEGRVARSKRSLDSDVPRGRSAWNGSAVDRPEARKRRRTENVELDPKAAKRPRR